MIVSEEAMSCDDSERYGQVLGVVFVAGRGKRGEKGPEKHVGSREPRSPISGASIQRKELREKDSEHWSHK